MKQITKNNYQEVISRNDKVVIIEFYRKSCGHCMMLKKELESITDKDTKFEWGKIDVEEEPYLLELYDVMALPTTIFMKDGEIKEKLIGYYPKAVILENASKLL